jgi:glycosyltransferase involved in cell wall biosynthesis
MNVLHVSPRYLPAVGGAEKHLHEFSRRLAQEGHAVRVLTSDALDAEYFWNPTKARVEGERASIDGAEVRRFPIQHFAGASLAYRGIRRGVSILSDLDAPLGLLNALAQLAPYLPTLNQALRAEAGPCDLIAGMNLAYESLLIPAYELAQRRKLPWVIFPLLHLGDAGVRKFYTMRQQLALVRNADAVLTQTRGEGEFFRGRGIDPRRLIRVGPGVNPDEIRGGEAARARAQFRLDGAVVLYLGTVSKDKGAATLLAAMKKLWAQGDSQTTLVLAGAVLDEWRAEFAQEPRVVQARTRVLGVVSDSERNDLLAACDLLALPSRVDSFGIVFLEAWLYRKPVIGADAGGIPDVIEHERDGLLVPFGDAEALARAIQRLRQDPAWAAALGEKGCAKVWAEHTWEQKYRIVRQVYEQIVARLPLDQVSEQMA